MAHQNSNEPLADLTRPGSLNGASDSRALLLKLFSGEMFFWIPEQCNSKGSCNEAYT